MNINSYHILWFLNRCGEDEVRCVARPRRTYPVLFVCLLASLALSGCLTRTIDPPLPYVKPAHDVPNVDPGRIRIVSRMEEIDLELQRLRGMFEQLQTTGANEGALRDLQERVALIERQLGIEPPPPSAKPTPGKQPMVQPLHAPDGRAQSSLPPVQPPQQIQIVGAPLDPEEKAYRDAYQFVRNGSLNEAAPSLERFIKEHPKSRFASDALYWLGEAFLAQGRHDEAVLQFDRVIKEFPGSKKELSALLRQGEAFEKMGDTPSARIIFDKLVKEHPHSPQARMAKAKLKDLPQQ